MRQRCLSFWVLVITIVSIPLYAQEPTSKPFIPEVQGLTAQLCIERFEDSGAMNGQPNMIVVYDILNNSEPAYEITLVGGGSTACVFLFPGNYNVVAISNRFNGPNGIFPSAVSPCRSQAYKLKLDSGERMTLDVWPAVAKDGGYSNCGWDLLPRGASQPGNCEQLHNPPECGDDKQS